MTNKYYYQGKLVRTSKTHDYSFAVIRERKDGTFTLIACSKTKELAERRLNSEMSNSKHNLKAEEERLKRMKRGLKVPKWWSKEENTIAGLEQLIEDRKKSIERYYEEAKVVELEKVEA